MYTRPSIHRSAVILATAVLMAAALIASGAQASSSPKQTHTAALNRLEHAAHKHLSDTRRDQARALNPREHQADRRQAETRQKQASATNPREHQAHVADNEHAHVSGTIVQTTRMKACSAALAQTWRDMGHFSDGYEAYLLGQPPCSSPSTSGGTSSP